MRCLEPGGECKLDAIHTTARCLEHLIHGDELDYAEAYAIASIVYYSGWDTPFMSDAQFDGLCDWLLKQESYRRIEWLDRGTLIAGSGYVLSDFPEYLHAAAREFRDG